MRWNLPDNVRELSRTFGQLRNTYRPELHYMRGPGPKWHAKRAAARDDANGEPALMPNPRSR